MTTERAAIVGLITGPVRRAEAERSLDELAGLASAAGATIALRVLQERDRPDPATFLGRGKVETLAAACDEADVDLVVFDHELTPAQLRQIESRLEQKVVDRTQLILDIFASRARTREGRLQVELAQLKYLMPRLVGGSDWLSRLGGGIGTRGPGETKLEVDRRKIRQRISHLNSQLEEVRRRRVQLRERRHKASVPTVALVGYTNAGKTTLFNLLAGEHAVASDALFVTLDPLVRRVKLSDRRELLVSDTVGFIDRLPHTLVAAFRATLEEVVAADLLLHVIDAGTPGHGTPRRRGQTDAGRGGCRRGTVNRRVQQVRSAGPGGPRAARAPRARRPVHLRRDGLRPGGSRGRDHRAPRRSTSGGSWWASTRPARPIASGWPKSTGSAAWPSTASATARS